MSKKKESVPVSGRRKVFRAISWVFLAAAVVSLLAIGAIHINEHVINGGLEASRQSDIKQTENTTTTAAKTTTAPTTTTTTAAPKPVGHYPPAFEQHSASSFYYLDEYNNCEIEDAFDNDLGTCWQDGASGYGEGEWLMVSSSTPQFVSYVTVYNGYQKPERDYYYENSRVKEFTLIFDDGSESFLLEDTPQPQTFYLDVPVSTCTVTFRIDSVYYGNTYADTCITELIIGAEYSAYLEFTSGTTETMTTVVDYGYSEVQQVVTDDISRDIVLVLDTSGSMGGTPLEQTKIAASKFVAQVAGNNTRISLVRFDTYAELLCEFTTDKELLFARIDGLYDRGMTDMYEGLSLASEQLINSSAERKMIVLMSDGMPDFPEYVLSLSDELKGDNGYLIYALGFFHSLTGYSRQEASELLRSVASEGYYYDVEEPDSLEYFFSDIATSISGTYSIMLETKTTVDVTVHYDGETLSTNEELYNCRTNFGSITFLGADGEQLMMRLLMGVDYAIEMEGRDEDNIDVILSFPDDKGVYNDVREFNDVPISSGSVITTDTIRDRDTTLCVDKNNDGRVDLKLRAGENAVAEEVETYEWLYITLAVAAALFVIMMIIGEERFERMTAPDPAKAAASAAYCNNGYPGEGGYGYQQPNGYGYQQPNGYGYQQPNGYPPRQGDYGYQQLYSPPQNNGSSYANTEPMMNGQNPGVDNVPPQPLYCSGCGALRTADAAFCGVCGKSVDR